MNLSPLWERYLKENEIEAIHWSKIGKAFATDDEIFEYAFQNNCLIFTNDLDFGTTLSKRRTQLPSILQIRTLEISIESVGDILVKCLQQNKEMFQEGVLVTIETDRLRIRTLPIH